MINKGMVIFGGTGDLAYRKLFPALYNIHSLGLLPEDFCVVGVGRRDYDNSAYRNIIKKWMKDFSRLKYTDEEFERFSKRISYYKMDMSDTSQYRDLVKYLRNIDGDEGCFTYYYAVSPGLFEPITEGLRGSESCLCNTKVIIEKPFGSTVESAKAIYENLIETYDPKNIYHIDHYLGKEMIINIMSLRFANAIFSGVWNREFIEKVEINVFEEVGVGSRGGYYDKSGALADMIQNHLFQIMTIVAMEQPKDKSAAAIKDAQSEVLRNLGHFEPEKIDNILLMAQYRGYREEEKVVKDSKTETYVALKLGIENSRWSGIPFYLRTGKKMKKRHSEVVISFRPQAPGVPQNRLVIKIQPDEGVVVDFNIKKPGTEKDIQAVEMDFCQSCILENRENTPEAYERLFMEVMNSDKSLFSRWDQIELSWRYTNAIMDAYRKHSGRLLEYEQGTEGPIKDF